ncbi:hypothetical protein H5410_009875 [Solanum commersonii]|uniref:Uncharacterized protein n=1 Tax=Solanum commersonii TaxID=4109 RepID=A0A9J6AJN9_SOLCO|nr:hypothetical protein H5410_009875 [Solanum commersonii]
MLPEIRRWKTAEREAEHFCTRKHNEHGRFISIISINNGGRSILVIPELALIAGWHDIAFKIERFIKCSKRMEVPGPPRITKANYPYAKAVKDRKWQSETIKEAEITNNASIIEVLTHAEDQENGFLERCLVGHLEGQMKEKPTLLEIRRQSSTRHLELTSMKCMEGHEEEALELLLQVDISRQARRMEVEAVARKQDAEVLKS